MRALRNGCGGAAGGALLALGLLLAGESGAHASAITVSAASSLTEAFREMADAFRKDHPNTEILLNLASSGVLLRQLDQGAPADVLATADAETMDEAEARGLVVKGSRVDFATNGLVLVAPARGGPGLHSLAGLLGPGVRRVAVGNPEFVPAGRYARAALEAAGLWSRLAGKLVLGNSVRQVLDYVARGEAEAGLVFATDPPVAQGRVRVVVPVPTPVVPRYPIAVVAASPQPEAARAFVAYVAGPRGRRALARHGFGPP